MEPVRDTTWPSLDSYSKDKFSQMLGIAQEKGLPVVIIDNSFTSGLSADDPETAEAAEKYDMLQKLMKTDGYQAVYEAGRFSVHFIP